jgi:hypothetical protein
MRVHQRTIKGPAKRGKISVSEARAAAREIETASYRVGMKKGDAFANKVSGFREEYTPLGLWQRHYDPSGAPKKRGRKKVSHAKKSTAKLASRKAAKKNSPRGSRRSVA